MKTIGNIIYTLIVIAWFTPLIIACAMPNEATSRIAALFMCLNFGVVGMLIADKFYRWYKSNLK